MATTPNLAPIQGFGGGAGSAHAATVVVNQDGSGDATTIAAAIALLTGDGVIYLESGTYAEQIVLPTDKSIRFRASVRAGVIWDLAAVVGTLIEVPSGAHSFEFEGIDFSCDALAAQIAFERTGGGAATPGTQLLFRNCNIGKSAADGFDTMFEATSGTFQTVIFEKSDGVARAATGRIANPATGSFTLEATDSALTGEIPVVATAPTFRMTRSLLLFQRNGRFGNSEFVGGFLEIQSSAIGIKVVSRSRFTGTRIAPGTGATVKVLELEGTADRTSFSGCIFDFQGVVITHLIDVLVGADEVNISGCSVNGGLTFAGGAVVKNAASGLIYTGQSGAITRVEEVAGADKGYYANNGDGFAGSTIIGPDSVVENHNVRTVTTTPVTLDLNDREVNVDSSGGNRVVNLPTAASARYKVFTIKKIAAANTVTIDGSGAETIDGATTVVLTADDDVIVIISDGTAWFILSRFTPSILTDFISIPWERDLVSLPTLVQLTAVITRQFDNGITQGVLNTHLTPRDMNFGVNPIIRIQMYVNVAGTGTGNVRLRLTVRYIAATELASKAADETLLITAPVATNTLEARQADVVFTLDASLMADGDDVNLFLERLGADGADSFDGNIGIQTRGRLDFSKV